MYIGESVSVRDEPTPKTKPNGSAIKLLSQREKKLITHVNGDFVWNIGSKIVIGTNIVAFLLDKTLNFKLPVLFVS